MSAVSIAGQAEWLGDAALQRLLEVLGSDGEEARIAGGAVRNALLGTPVSDIDIATTCLPDEVERRAAEAGFKTVPTGKEHGTITVVAKGYPYEVTTLRADIETDGRRARVVFGRNWKDDAERRDFTINALYANANGEVVDLVGALTDLESRTVRFIGDAEARIREDYLRILRFFRFFAWYGDGRPDAEAIRACARLKDGLDRLSAERVWTELKKLLSAPDPSRALLWMRQAGVLSKALPETDKWGIDAIHGIVAAERELGWTPDTLLRLESMVPPDAERMDAMAERLRMSSAERSRLVEWASTPAIGASTSELALRKIVYRGNAQAVVDRLRLSLAGSRAKVRSDDAALHDAGAFSRLLKVVENWQSPMFPIKGSDLVTLGMRQGKQLGERLKALEEEWIASGFQLERDALMERAARMEGETS